MSKTITLVSSEETSIEIPRELALYSVTIKDMLQDTEAGEVVSSSDILPISFPNISSASMNSIVTFLAEFHKRESEKVKTAEEKEITIEKRRLEDWQLEFFTNGKEMKTVFDILAASNFLDIKCVLDAACLFIASRIKNKTPDEVRTIFGITRQYTEEEEKKVREENPWCEL